MTLADWLSPRMDGTLHWQQSLAITLIAVLVGGPTYLWWRYDHGPKAEAAYAARQALGPSVEFRGTRIFASLDQHGLLPVETGPNRALICGIAEIDGVRTPVAVLGRARRRGYLVETAVFTPSDDDHWRYPGIGPLVLDLCVREGRIAS